MVAGVERTRTTAQATAEGLRLFIAGIPFHIEEGVIRKDFEDCGIVEDFFLMLDHDGNSKGKCFVTFRDPEGAKAALAFHGTDYGGRKIFVKAAEEKRKEDLVEGKGASKGKGKGEPAAAGKGAGKSKEGKQDRVPPRGVAKDDADKASFPDAKPEGCVSLCFNNIGEASEAELLKFLSGCDPQAVRVVRDRLTKVPRGIAFIDFRTTDEVDKAMTFNGKLLAGQAVEMRYEVPKARPRPEGCLSVVVKKLPPEATEKHVRKLFNGLKTLSNARVIYSAEGTCTGLGFADFTDPADVEAAMRRDGMAVGANTIFIGYETKQKKDKKKSSAVAGNEEQGSAKKKKRKESQAEEDVGDKAEEKKKAKKPKKAAAVDAGEKEPAAEEAETAAPSVAEAADASIENSKARKKKKRRIEEEAEQEPEESEVMDAVRVAKKRRTKGATDDS